LLAVRVGVGLDLVGLVTESLGDGWGLLDAETLLDKSAVARGRRKLGISNIEQGISNEEGKDK